MEEQPEVKKFRAIEVELEDDPYIKAEARMDNIAIIRTPVSEKE